LAEEVEFLLRKNGLGRWGHSMTTRKRESPTTGARIEGSTESAPAVREETGIVSATAASLRPGVSAEGGV